MSMARSTEISGFLDGREYTASFLYEFCALLVGNGVYANELAPTATNDNMTITHGSGHAWINGVLYKNEIPFNLDIETADGVLNRYDSLMLRLDLSRNETYAVIVKGDFAVSPTPPEVTRNAETFDLKICDVYIPAGCTKIAQDQIFDTRLDSAVCGVPAFLIEHLDTTSFYRQISTDLANFKNQEQMDFSEWEEAQKSEILNTLEQLKGLIGEDVVGSLINQINKRVTKTGDTMTGPLDMGSNCVTNLGDPVEETDAATKAYADMMLPKTGGDMTGPIAMGGNKVTGLGTPTDDADAVPKSYADTMIPKAGGDVSGWLNFTGESKGLKWVTEDGTEFRVRPYTSGNLFQVTVVTAEGKEAAAFNVKNDGSVWLGTPLPITSGGFGGTTAAKARANLGITPANIGAIPNTGGNVSGDITFEAGESETNGINFARPTNYKYEAHMDVLNNRLRIYRYDTAGTYMEVFSVSLADGEVILGGDMYVNPDMTIGTEYKLAEYYDGSPVYAKWVDFGALPNNTYKSLSIGVAPAKMVSISGILYDTGNVSFVPFGAACDIATCFVNSANLLVVETTSDRTAWTGKFLLKYTK